MSSRGQKRGPGRPRGTAAQQKRETERAREEAFERAKEHRHQDGETYHDAAQHETLSTSSLWHREHGRQDRHTAHEAQQKLTKIEEAEIVKLLRELDEWGVHAPPQFVLDRADDILRERGSTESATKAWYRRFKRRHPELKTVLSELKDVARSSAEKDPLRFNEAFNNVRNHSVKSEMCAHSHQFDRLYQEPYNIIAKRLFNADEKGFLMGVDTRNYVLVFRPGYDEEVRHYRASVPQDGNRELITVLDCINANGRVLPPFIIMKAMGFSFSWAKDSKLENAFFAHSKNGWINSALFLDWLRTVFEPQTREEAPNGEWRALILDNHKSHINWETVKFCLKYKIILCTLPSKTSGVLQPLDVACFRPLQQAYGNAVDKQTTGRIAMSKQDFARILPEARDCAFTRTHIVDGFERAGIYPLNPNRFEFLRKWREEQAATAEQPTAPSTPVRMS